VIDDRPDAVLACGEHVIEIEVLSTDTSRSAAGPRALSSPFMAPIAADVVGSRTLLAEAEVVPGRGDPTLQTLERLRCMPIPHEQPGHSVLKAVGTAGGREASAPTVMITPHAPLSLAGITFVYALLDQCIEGPERSATPFLRLHLGNGETHASSSTAWPAGWNRVAVDTAGMGDDLEVVAIEVGLEYGEEEAENALAVYPSESGIRSGFHLGEVGFSTRTRTW
jgi:alpha-L-rhamnosidase